MRSASSIPPTGSCGSGHGAAVVRGTTAGAPRSPQGLDACRVPLSATTRPEFKSITVVPVSTPTGTPSNDVIARRPVRVSVPAGSNANFPGEATDAVAPVTRLRTSIENGPLLKKPGGVTWSFGAPNPVASNGNGQRPVSTEA